MQTITGDTTMEEKGLKRTTELYEKLQDNLHRRADRLFAWLMVLQWLAGIAAAVWISPRTWIGTASQVHWHVWAAVFLGGAIASLPIFLAWKQPGRALTRHTIAVAQILFSALLIHLTGGRVETHFHVFGSLAFLAFYRDWRVLLSATVIVAVDHAARGIFWPQSVFGVLTASHWRWVEHAAWVIFEDTFLFISIRQSLAEMYDVASRRARLEGVNAEIERQVAERTAQLTEAHKDLAETSRQAGMAEMATGVLHNVGNVLNSVNVATSCVANSLKQSKAANLTKIVALLREHEADLGSFLTNDPKGKQVIAYLSRLAGHLGEEQTAALGELEQLQKNIKHINDIVRTQQSCAKKTDVPETLTVKELVQDAIRMNTGTLTRHNIDVITDFSDKISLTVEKNKVLQILINLVTNAKQACVASGYEAKKVTISAANGNGRVRITVADNGVGIPPENLSRLFVHGFTTKKDGHGFGLHSCAAAAKEMAGTLLVHSDGAGKGASFTLELPVEPPGEVAQDQPQSMSRTA